MYLDPSLTVTIISTVQCDDTYAWYSLKLLSIKTLRNLLETAMFHKVQPMKHEIMDNSCVNQQRNRHENSMKSIFLGYDTIIILTVKFS